MASPSDVPPLLDDEQSPLPPPRNGRSLFFNEETEEESPLHLVETTAADDVAGSASADPWSESDEWSDDDPTSSAASFPEKPAQLLSKAQMRQTARTAVKIGTGVAHTVAARSELEQRAGLYQADDDDCAAIGDPLADMAYRRGDVVTGKLSPDANDLIKSAMGVAGYFAKQVALMGQIRQAQAAQAAGEVQHIPGAE